MPGPLAVSRSDGSPARTSPVGITGSPALVHGRVAECARIETLLADAQAGRSGALVICGGAGCGKTSLLTHAVERAEGFDVLQTAGIEAESQISFSGLDEMLSPILELVDGIPAPQRDAIRAAFDLAPSAKAARGAIFRAVLSVLAAAAEARPILCIIDDTHRLDPDSVAALAFAARRLKVEGIAMLFATGEEERSSLAGLEQLHLDGLDAEAARDLLQGHACAYVATEVASRIRDGVGGNPRALVDVAAGLSADELAGRAPLPTPLPVVTADSRYLGAAAALSPAAQDMLVTAAAADTQTLHAIVQEGAVPGVTTAALEECEAAALIVFEDGRLKFRHPLVRAALYHAAPPSKQRASHRALAAASSGERRALHLAAAATGADEAVAAELEEAAEGALHRGSHVIASNWFLRAASFSPARETWARRLYRAADAAWRGGQQTHAEQLVEQAGNAAQDPMVRADLEHLRALIELESHREVSAYRRLMTEADRVQALDADRASRLLTSAVAAAPVDERPAVARRAYEHSPRDGGHTDLHATVSLARAVAEAGNRHESIELLARARSLLESNDRLADNPEALLAYADAFIQAYGHGDAFVHDVVGRAVAIARDRGALGTLTLALLQLGRLDLGAGRWAEAHAAGSEALQLVCDAELERTSADAHALLARLAALRGRNSDCRRHATTIRNLAHSKPTCPCIETTLGLLALGRGDLAEAVARLQSGVPEWAPDLVEAYVRAGRTEHANRVAAIDRDAFRQSNHPWTRVRAAWAAALVAADDEYEPAFETAMEALVPLVSESSFECARLRLNWGERLRRSGRRIDAREHLRAAHDVFELLGAEPWAEQARAELRASGEIARRRNPSTLDELTPQELQVLRQIAAGATYRQAAQNLFLSPKTIEYHLHKIYRKLDVGSRHQLVARLETLERGSSPGEAES
jgi:DNA-binding CsgD family transcriptional regulator